MLGCISGFNLAFASEASVSLALLPFFAWPKPKIPSFIGLSLLRNHTEKLATQANLGYKVKPFMQVLLPSHRWLQIILGRVLGGYSTIVCTGRLRPEVQPFTLLYIIFHQQAAPFVHLLLIDKWDPFHIPCIELCIPFNCCKCTDC